MNPFAQVVMGEMTAFGLVFSRMTGFLLVSPFPGNFATTSQKVGLAVVLAWLSVQVADVSHIPKTLGLELFVGAGLEVACGLVVGFTFRLVLHAADVFGAVSSHATGLSAASTFNPLTESQDASLSRVVTLIATVTVLAAGVHRHVLAYLVGSLTTIPVGGPGNVAHAAPLMWRLLSESMTLGVTLGLPVLSIGVVLQVALAFIARAAPQMQIFNVGFSVLIGGGLVVLGATIRESLAMLAGALGELPVRLDTLLATLKGG